MTTAQPPTHTPPPLAYILVRPCPPAGNTQRKVHLVLAPQSNERPATVTTVCQTEFSYTALERLPRFTGMPCERCVAHAPQV